MLCACGCRPLVRPNARAVATCTAARRVVAPSTCHESAACVTQELRDVLLDLVDLAQTLQAADLREPEARELLSTIGRHAPRSGGGGGGLSAELSPSWARFMRGVEECESHLLTHARL